MKKYIWIGKRKRNDPCKGMKTKITMYLLYLHYANDS